MGWFTWIFLYAVCLVVAPPLVFVLMIAHILKSLEKGKRRREEQTIIDAIRKSGLGK